MTIQGSELVFTHRPRLIVGGIVILWYIYRYIYRSDVGIYTAFTDVLDDVAPRRSYARYAKHIYTMMTILLFGMTLAQPVLRDQSESVTKKGIDIALVLDISNSMTATDIQPDRLSAAKQTIQDFIDELEADRVGLVVFAGKPFTSVPLTFDYAFVQDFLAELSVETIDQGAWGLGGTAIGDALVLGAKLFEQVGDEEPKNNKNDDTREQIMILLSDGAPTQGSLDPQIAAGYAVEQGVDIYTIGLGSIETTYIQVQTPFGIQQQAIPGVDEQTMKAIADIGSGKYRNAASGKVLEQVFDELSTLTKTELSIDEVVTDQKLWKWGVIGLLLMLLVYIGVWGRE